MKAIIVDDEPKAIELLKSYLAHFSRFELVGTFRNGLKAFEFLSNEPVDLVFLDINMPHINGISLSKIIAKGTKVIFTTAYSEYAVESYEVEAVDYLLKPIGLERFTRAVSKVLPESRGNEEYSMEPVLVKSGSRTYRVDPGSIQYIQKDGNYAVYFTGDQRIIARESISETLQSLPGYFLQVHKSFIVNVRQVSSMDKDVLHIGSTEIPIGASFKEKAREVILEG